MPSRSWTVHFMSLRRCCPNHSAIHNHSSLIACAFHGHIHTIKHSFICLSPTCILVLLVCFWPPYTKPSLLCWHPFPFDLPGVVGIYLEWLAAALHIVTAVVSAAGRPLLMGNHYYYKALHGEEFGIRRPASREATPVHYAVRIQSQN